jgi:hypothetical protein
MVVRVRVNAVLVLMIEMMNDDDTKSEFQVPVSCRSGKAFVLCERVTKLPRFEIGQAKALSVDGRPTGIQIKRRDVKQDPEVHD